MRTWVVGIVIGACILTSACEKIPKGHTPGSGENTSAVKVKPKSEGLLKPWDFTYDCVTNEKLGLGELNRCRDDLEIAESDRRKGTK